jgi:hypothetical protein
MMSARCAYPFESGDEAPLSRGPGVSFPGRAPAYGAKHVAFFFIFIFFASCND